MPYDRPPERQSRSAYDTSPPVPMRWSNDGVHLPFRHSPQPQESNSGQQGQTALPSGPSTGPSVRPRLSTPSSFTNIGSGGPPLTAASDTAPLSIPPAGPSPTVEVSYDPVHDSEDLEGFMVRLWTRPATDT
jgi:hypothetical protein